MTKDRLTQKSPEASISGLVAYNGVSCYQAIFAGKNSAKRSS